MSAGSAKCRNVNKPQHDIILDKGDRMEKFETVCDLAVILTRDIVLMDMTDMHLSNSFIAFIC